MNATAIDIKAMLEFYASDVESSSQEEITLYPIFIGKEPAQPTKTITIFETLGYHRLTYDRTEVYEMPSVQIRVRSTSYLEGWEVISSIKNLLHGRANETWDGTFYTLIQCEKGPGLLDFDKEQSVRFVIFFDIQRR